MILNDTFIGSTLKDALIQILATHPKALMSFQGKELDLRDIPLEFVSWGSRTIVREDRRPECIHLVTADKEGIEDREWIVVFYRQGA